jgi:hypothetical protein
MRRNVLNYAAVSKKGGFRNVPCCSLRLGRSVRGRLRGHWTGRHEWTAGQVTWLSLEISISLMPSSSAMSILRGQVDRLGSLLDRSFR